MSPFLPLLPSVLPGWDVSFLWVSPFTGIWRCQKPMADVGSPAALHLLRPDLQNRCHVLQGHWLWLRNRLCLPRALVQEGRTERERELGLGGGRVLEEHQVLSSHFVCSLSLSFVTCEHSLLSVLGNSVLFLLSETPDKAQFLAD